MKNKTIVSLAVASLLTVGSLSPLAIENAAAEELRYYYPEFQTCEVTSEQISCTNMIETETVTTYRMPLYFGTGDLTNCCGAVAGSIVVGYYDRYYDYLIPDWTPYYSNGNYKRADTTYVPAVIEELYTLMRTNVDDVGVSQSDCKNGLQTYFTNKGLTLSYSTIESNSTFDLSLYQQSIAQNKPVILFCNNVTISSIGYSSTQGLGTIGHYPISGGHIVIGYGYSTVNYYNGDTIFRSDNYLLVSSGRSGMEDVYINIGSTSWLVDGYSISVA